MMANSYVIIGAGPAGIAAAHSIRQADSNAQIAVLTDEPYAFYSRPGIAYLLIDMVTTDQLIAYPELHWRTQRIKIVTGVRVSNIYPDEHRLKLTDGRSIAYDKLLIATGASAVGANQFPGGHLDGVVTFDTLDDAKNLINRAKLAQQAVVVGGGITALEVAEGLAHQGVETHYLLRKDTLWSSLLNQQESALVERQIQTHGVHIHYREEIAEIIGKDHVTAVRLKSGPTLSAEIVAVCIGVHPQLEMAQQAGINTGRGILVDEYLQTSAPDIYAAGDCAQIYDRWSGQYHLDCLWPTASDSGKIAGENMAGNRTPYLKGVPFNAALLFGVHMTAIGQIGTGLRDVEESAETEEVLFISRGSSEVWSAFPGDGYASAWANDGTSTQRLALRHQKIVGALLLGNQKLADPLRDLIQHEVDISVERLALLSGGIQLETAVLSAWSRWKHISHTSG